MIAFRAKHNRWVAQCWVLLAFFATASCGERATAQPSSIPELRSDLRSGDAETRGAALRKLSAYGAKATDALEDMLPLLEDSDFSVALSAQTAVWSVGGNTPCVAEAYERALQNIPRDKTGGFVVRKGGIYTILRREKLEEYGVKQAVRDAEDTDVNLRRCAEDILQVAVARADQRTIEVLTALLAENQPDAVMLRVITCLSALGPKAREALPHLRKLATSKQGQEILGAAQRAIVSIEAGVPQPDREKPEESQPPPRPSDPE